MTPAEFFEVLRGRAGGGGIAIVTPAPEILSDAAARDAIRGLKASVEAASPVLAPFIGQIGYRQAQRGETANALTLDANYVRRTDAEMHWKES
jgi:hypothetical protein